MMLKFPLALALVFVAVVAADGPVNAGSIADCSALTPRSTPATDARDLRPDDIKIVAGLGDSIMAGFGAKGIRGSSILNVSSLHEIRGVSYALGGDDDAITIPNFFKQYSPTLIGASVGEHIVEYCKAWRCLPFQYQPNKDRLNAAQSGAMAYNLNHELNYLLPALKNFSGTRYQTDWKMINIQIGSNDQCASCIDDMMNITRPEMYGSYLDKAVARIQQNIPRVLVNLIGVFNVSGIYDITSGQKYCEPFKHSSFMFNKAECSCGIDKTYHATMNNLAAGYNQQVQKIYQKYKALSNENFAVMYSPAPINITSFPIDGFSNIDCFHPSVKGHQWIAKTLWNNFFQPQANRPTVFNWNPDVQVYCPKNTDRFLLD